MGGRGWNGARKEQNRAETGQGGNPAVPSQSHCIWDSYTTAAGLWAVYPFGQQRLTLVQGKKCSITWRRPAGFSWAGCHARFSGTTASACFVLNGVGMCLSLNALFGCIIKHLAGHPAPSLALGKKNKEVEWESFSIKAQDLKGSGNHIFEGRHLT